MKAGIQHVELRTIRLPQHVNGPDRYLSRSVMCLSQLAAAICLCVVQAPLAHAQGARTSGDEIAVNPEPSGSKPDRNIPRDEAEPSGFNTGPTKQIVKGCVGPVSFCNVYFGS